MVTIITTDALRGTSASTPRPRALVCAYVSAPAAPTTQVSSVVFGDQKWAGIRLDGHMTATGPSAWSPPI